MKLERTSTEHHIQLRHVEGDSSGKITSLDNKTKQLVNETRNTIDKFKLMEEKEREKMEARLVNHLDRMNSSRDIKTVSIHTLSSPRASHIYCNFSSILVMYKPSPIYLHY